MYMVLKGGEKTSRGGGVHMDFDSHMQTGLISHNVGSMDYGDVPMSSMMALQQQQHHHQTLANNHHHHHHQHLMAYNNPTSSTPSSLVTTTNNNSSNIPSPPHPHHHSDMNGEPLYQPSLFQAYYGNQVGGSHYLLPLQESPQDHDLKHHLTNNKLSSSSSMPVHAVDSSFRISESEALRAQIMSHPQYPQLVTAYLNCQKVGAPPEIVAGLDELSREYPNHLSIRPTVGFGSDPDLDQFMEDYCNLLQRYHEELTTPFKEAMSFFRKIELQLNSLSKGSIKFSHSGEAEEKEETNASSEEDGSSGEIEFHDADPLAEEAKLKEKLLRKYSGYISALKHEFLKKKKKGKLPKEARQKLLDWWNQHYKWPYPSETEKTWLAESTGLDQKQINNWFINQRKRHWKPSEDLIHYSMVEDSNNAATSTANHHYSPVNPFPDSATLKAQMGLLPMDQF